MDINFAFLPSTQVIRGPGQAQQGLVGRGHLSCFGGQVRDFSFQRGCWALSFFPG